MAFLAAPAAAQMSENPLIPGGNSAPPGPQPKAVVDRPLYDFGSALEGKMVDHTFALRNAGSAYLDIRGVKTSCGCTVATPSKSHLAPGETADIKVGFDTHFQKGHQVRTVTAMTNDPDNPTVPMTMQGNVKLQAEATPAQVDFGSVPKGTEKSQEVVVSDLVGGGNFIVGPLSNSSHDLKVIQAVRADGKSGATLKVTMLKSMPVGPFDDTIKVTTNRSLIQIDVFGTVAGDLKLEPAQVSFGLVPRGQDVVRILRLSNTGSKTIKVTSVASDSDSVVARADAMPGGREYKITVTLKHGAPDGQIRGTLAIKTDDPDQAKIDIPFYAIVGPYRG